MEHLNETDATTVNDPLAVLDQLGNFVKATGKTSEQLICEHLRDKISL